MVSTQKNEPFDGLNFFIFLRRYLYTVLDSCLTMTTTVTMTLETMRMTLPMTLETMRMTLSMTMLMPITIGVLYASLIYIYEFCFLPGLFFLLPCVDTFRSVDLRTFSYDIPPQEVSTRFNSKYNITKLLLVIKQHLHIYTQYKYQLNTWKQKQSQKKSENVCGENTYFQLECFLLQNNAFILRKKQTHTSRLFLQIKVNMYIEHKCVSLKTITHKILKKHM